MKKLTIILAFSALAAATALAQPSQAVKDLADYVSPANVPAAPAKFTYAPDGNGYLQLSADGKRVERYEIASGKLIETIFDVTTARETSLSKIEGFELSKNGRFMLVYTDAEYIYRRSFTASYYVYETYTRMLTPISKEHKRQQSPLMSEDGRMVAFVADNNIYIHKNDYNSEVAVTKDGMKNQIINGVPDWVYEEEFTTTCSMAWSPDNLTLSFLRYDESKVPLYSLPIYEGTCDPKKEYALYPGTYSYKYPLPGVANSIVTLHSYDVENRKITDIALPDKKIEYIPRIAYGPDAETLLVSTLNRDQNHFEIYRANPKSGVVKSVYVEDSKGWIAPETYENLTYQPDGFVVMSYKSGYSQLYKYTYAGALSRTLTSGNADVTAFYGIDAKGTCYYQAAEPTPMDRTVYSIDVKGKKTLLSKPSGTTSARFAPDMAMAVFQYSDTETPPVHTLVNNSGRQLRVIEDNAAYAARYAGRLPKKEFFTIQSDGYTLNGYVMRPAGATNCPVIMSQYSGPGSQQVLNKWTLDWEQYFVNQGYAVVCVDGRGTGGRGADFMFTVYMHLGRYETIDQVNAAKWAASQPWADASRIGIYGWSYGGYESLMAASASGAPYAAAVAIAPVTSWRYYDSIYTERYMRTPQQNDDNYDAGSPIDRAGALGCPLLIMYGTADDNVHPANSLQYVSALQSHGILCDMLVFPNQNHSIYYCGARAIVWAKMLDFFNKTLRP